MRYYLLNDEEKEVVYEYFDFDVFSWFEIEDMGEVLEFLGYEVEYIDDETLTAYW